LFQDSAGTTPVTAVDQPVGLMLDKSGYGNNASQATGVSRPLLKIDTNGKYYLLFDGVNDSFTTSSINFTSTDKMSVFAGLRKLSDAATGMFVELSSSIFAFPGVFNLIAPSGAFNNYQLSSGGTVVAAVAPSGFAAPISNVLTGICNISGDVVTLRANGAQVATSSSNQGTGNYGNYPLYIGRRGGSSLPFNGRLYSLIVVGKAVTAGELSDTETWVNGKTGAY
jgi:hypothetical protein